MTVAGSDSRPPMALPPHDLNAERSLLRDMLLSGEAIVAVTEVVVADDFYRPAHRQLFEAILRVHRRDEPADALTVAADLHEVGALHLVEELEAVVGATPVGSGDVLASARVVEQTAILRRLAEASEAIRIMAYEGSGDALEAVDRAQALIYGVGQRPAPPTLPIIGLLGDALDRLEKLYEKGDQVSGLPTGFGLLDHQLSGLQPFDLVIIGGRPGSGKTSLALSIATTAARRTQRPTMIISLELSTAQLTTRLIGAEGSVEARRMRSGHLAAGDWKGISTAMSRLYEAPIHVASDARMTIVDVRSKARRLRSELGDLGLIVVDSIQLLDAPSPAQTRQDEVDDVIRGLKLLARELDCTIIGVSQLSRYVESRTNKRPVLADLRDSGSIEAHSDVVLLLYRDELYDDNSPDQGLVEVIVAKHRSGQPGTLMLQFSPDFMSLTDPPEP